MKKRFFALLLAMCMICTLLPFGALADSSPETVTSKVTYMQTESRSMLKMLNDFRTGSDAWAWNSSNSKKVYSNNLKKLTYDYSLEKIAMQRAAEIAISFSHTRTNGESCFTAYDIVYYSAGENIAAGYANAKAAFVGWQETNEKYAGQGHRRNMLSGDFNAVGIACVNYNGYNYWVQEFGYIPEPNTKATAANDSASNVKLGISKDLLTSVSLSVNGGSSVSVAAGKSAELPKLTAKITMADTWPGGACKVTPKAKWTSADTSIAKISDGKLVGVSAGSTSISASVLGKSVKVTVNVTGAATTPSDPADPFVDVDKGSVYYDAVMWAYYHEPEQITGGFDATHFKPQNPCTRGQVVTFLWRAAGCPEPENAKSPFVDVENSGSCKPYYKAILWAAEQGITTGVDKNHFQPSATVTRAQFVTFLWRYEGESDTNGSISGFKDARSIAKPFRTAVAWAVENGITTGYNDKTFRPSDTCTRWAVVLFMYRDLG